MIPCKAIPWEPFPNSKNTLFLFKRSVVISWDKPLPGGLCKPGWAHSSSPVYDWSGRLVFMTCRWFHCQKVRGSHSEHWGRAAFKGLTALMTESSVAHHAAFLRDNALRLTCGSHRAGRSTAEKHTPTRDRFSISTWLAVPPYPWCLTLFSRLQKVLCHHCLCLPYSKEKQCTHNAQFSFKHLLKPPLLSDQIHPPLYAHCFGFWSRNCSCCLSSDLVWASKLKRTALKSCWSV